MTGKCVDCGKQSYNGSYDMLFCHEKEAQVEMHDTCDAFEPHAEIEKQAEAAMKEFSATLIETGTAPRRATVDHVIEIAAALVNGEPWDMKSSAIENAVGLAKRIVDEGYLVTGTDDTRQELEKMTALYEDARKTILSLKVDLDRHIIANRGRTKNG